MKKIVLCVPEGMNKALETAGKEAIGEFVSMFPEYKDSFEIEIRNDAHIRDKEISQARYNTLSPERKRGFIRSPRGTWLVPHKSMEWYILSSQAANASNKVDASKFVELQNKKISNDITVSLCNGIFSMPNKNEVLYGLTLTNDIVVSTKSCQNPEFLKTIIIHELGHVFNATHRNRANTVYDKTKGTHCKNDLCIMGPDDYDRLNVERLSRQNERSPLHPQGRPPFCDECIASMREYMSHMPELVRRVQTQQIPTPQQQPVSRPIIMPTGLPTAPLPPTEQWTEVLPVLPHNNREWKNDIREFYKNVAARDGDTYKENIRSQNYVARIKRADGSTLEIQANNEFNIALGATKTPQRDNLPSLKDMRDLVKLTQQKKSGMNFGENNEPEFNGRLLIACLEVQPKPLAMRNRPQITPEFLAQLQPETKRHLQALINGRQQQQQRPQQNTR